jgi:hypothetical protein
MKWKGEYEEAGIHDIIISELNKDMESAEVYHDSNNKLLIFPFSKIIQFYG